MFQKSLTSEFVDLLEYSCHSFFTYPLHIFSLSLDVEGAETFIMNDFPFDKYTIQVMTVERPDEQLKALFLKNGYRFLKRLSYFGETLWAKESLLESLDQSALDPQRTGKKAGGYEYTFDFEANRIIKV